MELIVGGGVIIVNNELKNCIACSNGTWEEKDNQDMVRGVEGVNKSQRSWRGGQRGKGGGHGKSCRLLQELWLLFSEKQGVISGL